MECKIRADALNSHVYPVRTEMDAMKQIMISHVCSTAESKLKYFPVDKTLFVDLFYGHGQIKMHNRRRMFYIEKRIRMRSQKYYKK